MKDPFADYRVDETPTEEPFARLNQLVLDLVAAQAAVVKAEQDLKKAQAALRQVEEQDLPAHMDSLGLEEFKTKGGLVIKVVSRIRASIGDRKVEAFKWLLGHNYGAIIKRTVEVRFNTDQEKEAEKLYLELSQREGNAGVRQEMKVEGTTLTAFVKERLEAGEDIPHDIFGVFDQRYAKVEAVKDR